MASTACALSPLSLSFLLSLSCHPRQICLPAWPPETRKLLNPTHILLGYRPQDDKISVRLPPYRYRPWIEYQAMPG